MQFFKVDHFLGCLRLETGGLILGWMGAIASGVVTVVCTLFWCISSISVQPEKFKKETKDTSANLKIGKQINDQMLVNRFDIILYTLKNFSCTWFMQSVT
jgi:hypothetical protein